MKFLILQTIKRSGSLLLLLLISFVNSPSRANSSPFIFIENKGQWPEDVLFKSEIPGGYLFVKESGLEYFFYDTKALSKLHLSNQNKENLKATVQKIRTQSVALKFLEANLPKIRPENVTETKYNYYYGNDESKWVHGASGYKEVWLTNIYENIDFRLYGLGEALKYEYVVHPGAKPEFIKMAYTGQDEIQLNEGQLVLKTKVNSFKEFEPFTFQKNANLKASVKSTFVLKSNEVSFNIDSYDTSRDLIIDPELVFSTYSGSYSDNWSHTATFDSKGNLYAGGTVFGPSFPITENNVQSETGGTGYLITDVVIMKYSADGNQLLYATFLGGIESEVPHSLICNQKDDLIIFGTTSSPDFPTSSNAFQKEFKGGNPNTLALTTNIEFFYGTDIFLTVLAEDGSSIKGSSFLGGTENDGIHDYRAFLIQNYGDEFRGEVYVDDNDDIYIASITSSGDFPILGSSGKIASGYDAVIAQLSPDLASLRWSTFLGGKKYDAGYGIRVNSNKEVFVVGSTLSNDLDTTPNALYRDLQGEADGFIAKFKNGLLQAMTYLGTEKEDLGSMIDLDNESNVYIFGLTHGEYPIKGTVYQNPGSGQFIHALNSNLATSLFSTVIGSGNGVGTVDLVPTAFLVNDCKNIYLAGWGGIINKENGYNENSTTEGLPITKDAYRTETTGSNYYIAILEAGAKSLLYGTYFGSEAPENDDERGDHLDGGTCRFDKNGIIYHSACVCRATNSGFVSFPMVNAVQPNHNYSNCNMAAFKFDIAGLEAKFDLLEREDRNPEEVCAGAEVSFDNNSKGGNTYQWSVNGEVISRLENPKYVFERAGEYEVKLEAFNVITCAKSDSSFRTVKVIPFDVSVSRDTTICSGTSFHVLAKGGISYKWLPQGLFDNPNVSNPLVTVDSATTLTVEIGDEKCLVKKEIHVNTSDEKGDFIVSKDKTICRGGTITLAASGQADYFVWSSEDFSDSIKNYITLAPEKSSNYFVQAFYPDGCKPVKSIQVNIDNSSRPDFDYRIDYNCGEPFKLVFANTSIGEANYQWMMGDGNSLSGEIPVNYSYKKPGDYEVTLKSKSAMGCPFEMVKKVTIPADDGLIPNAFSPNNDGINDTFVIGISDASLSIYTRWGKRIFETQNYQNDWGKDAAAGVYFYEINLPNSKICKGWLEVFP